MKPEAFLIARFCAPEAFDAIKMARYLNLHGKGVGYANLRGLYAWVHNELINKARAPELIGEMPFGFSAYLDRFDAKNAKLLIDVRVTNFKVFDKFCQLVKKRYDDVHIVLLAGDPMAQFNAFCHALDKQAWERSRDYFFKHELYRWDRMIASGEKWSANFTLMPAGVHQENEMRCLEACGVACPKELAQMPYPLSTQGQELNGFIGLPTFLDTVSLAEWRSAIEAWERAYAPAPVRMVEGRDFYELQSRLERSCRYVRKRYPQLESVLDTDPQRYADRPLYAGLSDAERDSFIGMLPEATREKLRVGFDILQRGFRPFYKKFFTRLAGKVPVEVGEDLAIPRCAVITFAYNHEKYISQCLESVCEQNLDFPFEHIVVDDASTDATPDIIRAYAEKYPHIKPILFKSKPPTPIVAAFNSCRSEYVALCDGDDYFCDADKLKKQVGLLDAYPDLSLAFCLTEVFFEDGSPSYIYCPQRITGKKKPVYTLEDLLQGNLMQTSSVMYRWRFRAGLPRWFRPTLVPGDWYWHLLHAELGPLGFIPEVMTRYRRHAGSVYESADKKDTVAHRLQHGLKELEMYQHCNEHFHFKYHASFSRLATGVFANFAQSFSNDGSSAVLDRASVLFPDFARDFLTGLRNLPGAPDAADAS